MEIRTKLLKLYVDHGVIAVLAGHIHSRIISEYKGIQLVTGEATSKSKGGKLGFRLWNVNSAKSIKHEFIPLKVKFNKDGNIVMPDGSIKDSNISRKDLDLDLSQYKLLKPMAIQFMQKGIEVKAFVTKLDKILKSSKSDEPIKKEATSLKEELFKYIIKRFDGLIKKANTQPVMATEEIKTFLKSVSRLEPTANLVKQYSEFKKSEGYKASVKVDKEIQKCRKKIGDKILSAKKLKPIFRNLNKLIEKHPDLEISKLAQSLVSYAHRK